ncbi:unnamed protein product [Malus baccata var. baccata]
MGRRHMAQSILGPNAQKRHRNHRYTLRENVSSQLHAHVKKSPNEAVNFKKMFEPELFGLSLKQALGKNVEGSIYVEELGTTLSRNDVFEILVTDVLKGATETDWRDFFPYLRWIPNKNLEMKIQNICFRRKAVMSVLIKEQMKRIASGQEVNCFLDFLLYCLKYKRRKANANVISTSSTISSSDAEIEALQTTQMNKGKGIAERLQEEIQNACGCDKVSEERLSQLPYLNAVFHETLRKHSPVPVALTKYVDEDTQLGGYYIPAGTQIAVNLYGCNMDKNKWEMPEEWKPERFLEKEKWDSMELQKTMAFGAGKRACAGSLQATLIVCTTIGRLVQEFEWRLREGDEEEDTAIFTNHQLHAMHAIIKPRN